MIEQRLHEHGLIIPAAVTPLGNYKAHHISGNLLFISGQGPVGEAGEICGTVGADMEVAEAVKAAQVAGLNILAQAKLACAGDLMRIRQCIRLAGFVRAVPEFTAHPDVVNGASDLMALAFGEAGKHIRVAVGVTSLPRGWVVEIEALFEID